MNLNFKPTTKNDNMPYHVELRYAFNHGDSECV